MMAVRMAAPFAEVFAGLLPAAEAWAKANGLLGRLWKAGKAGLERCDRTATRCIRWRCGRRGEVVSRGIEKLLHTSHRRDVEDDAEFLRQQAAFCRQAAEVVNTAEAKRALLEAAALFEAEAREQQSSSGIRLIARNDP